MLSVTELEQQGPLLLQLARHAIEFGSEHGHAPVLDCATYCASLGSDGACFVTLRKQRELRGCIGNLTPHQALVQDVADNAFASAFRDPRFPPVNREEIPLLHIGISVLTPREGIDFDNEEELLAALRPGVDGLLLEDNGHRGTFLPSVWQELPGRREFLRNLKHKAGLSPDYWSDTLKVFRYTTVSLEE